MARRADDFTTTARGGAGRAAAATNSNLSAKWVTNGYNTGMGVGVCECALLRAQLGS